MATTFRMVDGDIYFDVNGRLETIGNFDKVSQDIAEVLLTNLDIDRDFGSELNVVATDPSFNISEQQVSSFVADAIDRLRALQRTNSTTTRQEEIAAIEALEVYKNDQTEILFGVAVRTTEGTSVDSAARLSRKTTSLEHQLPPSVYMQHQEYEDKIANKNPVIVGEVKK